MSDEGGKGEKGGKYFRLCDGRKGRKVAPLKGRATFPTLIFRPCGVGQAPPIPDRRLQRSPMEPARRAYAGPGVSETP
jgi:hypothetical protein